MSDSFTFEEAASTPKGGGFSFDEAQTERRRTPSFGDLNPTVGGAQGAAAILSGAVAAPIAGLSGIAAAFAKALDISDTEAADVVRKVQEHLTYQPPSETGKAVAGAIAYPFEKLAEVGDKAGEKVADATGSPALGAATTTAIQAAPMALGPVAGKVGGKLRTMEVAAAEKRAKIAALEEPVREGVAAARELGLKVTPVEADAGVAARSAEGLAGSAKLQKAASEANVPVINDLIRKDVRLAENEPLTVDNLAKRREEAGKAYDDLRALDDLEVDKAYKRSEHSPELRSTWEHNPAMDPRTNFVLSAGDAVDSIKQLRSEASQYFKAWKRDAQPETLKKAEGYAEAAADVEALIERNLQRTGQTELLGAFRDARTQIAKVHQAEMAVNEVTGNIDARVYGNMLKRDKAAETKGTLTGGALAVAKFARQFEKLVQPAEKIGHVGMDFGDLALAAMKGFGGGIAGHAAAGAVGGGAGAAAALLARPVTRAAILSGPVQRAITRPKAYDQSMAAQLAQATLDAQAAPAVGASESAVGTRRRDELLRLLGR